ncbi:MAG: hypothetical protein KBS35_02475 [Mycoplasma sp.]|nr:hypothetical protein [Candidatus Hennigella equi]
MKLKRLLLGSCVSAVSGGLLATILTSCGAVKIEDDLKVELDDQGRFVDEISFQDALKAALANQSSWAALKTALANELVYKWFEDRASKDKDSKDKNDSFRTTLDEIKYNVDEDYKKLVDDLKAKYGSQHKFYLQNEHLSQYGGTEESYKHAKIVEQLRTKFIDNVFKTNYFTFRSGDESKDLPQYFTNVNTYVKEDVLKDPANWSKIGFYAKANPNFDVKSEDDVNQLAKHPDGDYATIQNFVFNKWFETERPFFSSAALFKYAKPVESGGELSNIYNKDYTGDVTDPNESFPFFGGQAISNGYTSSRGFYRWYHALEDAEFQENGLYEDEDDVEHYNYTISIPAEYSEDGQTVLLCSANQMFGGSNALYVPYAVAAGSLLKQMLTTNKTPTKQNTIDQDTLANNVGNDEPLDVDSDIIFKNFFYTKQPGSNIPSYLDLNTIYGGLVGDYYHCPIFKSDSTFKYFYGANETTNGIRYITNNVQVPLKPRSGSFQAAEQPWILELNEAGVHAQTIDAYLYVLQGQTGTVLTRWKEAVKFRLLQKLYYDTSIVSADLFGKAGSDDGGKLKTYFTDNFDNIILEMAIHDDLKEGGNLNIFRKIESFKDSFSFEKSFINEVYLDQLFKTSALSDLMTYLDYTIDFDLLKKNNATIINANSTIYKYKNAQIANLKSKKGKKKYTNGLIAPLDALYETNSSFETTHFYSEILQGVIVSEVKEWANTEFDNARKQIEGCNFVKNINNIPVDSTLEGLSPQVKAAKDTLSNRFWFKSSIIDKMMYSFMSNKTLANEIKSKTYENYNKNEVSYVDTNYKHEHIISGSHGALPAAFYASKILTGDNNLASYITRSQIQSSSFDDIIRTAYTNKLDKSKAIDGLYCDDQLNDDVYNITMTYLAKHNFENFYNNIKIGDTEKALVGYLVKYNAIDHDWLQPNVGLTVDTIMSGETAYNWSANVENMFDAFGYAGWSSETPTKDDRTGRVNYDEYWHVVPKKFDITGSNAMQFAGFVGIQTSGNNQLDSSSGLKDAAFKDFAKATEDSPVLSDAGGEHEQNEGSLFAWACSSSKEAAEKYAIKNAVEPVGAGTPITDSQFSVIPEARKLACKIIACTTTDDLRTLAESISESFIGGSLFKQIARRELEIDKDKPVQDLKYKMVGELLKVEEGTGNLVYKKALQRVKNVELHRTTSSKYCFEDENNGYKLLMTQINKEDVLEKKLAPRWNGTAWVLDDSPLTLQEFWYIFAKMAADNSIQQLAIADAVKTKFGDKKLIVHDAQLYNQFDSVWIKDWVKKPIGE